MSLREYRNRKKAKPIPTVQNSNVNSNEAMISKTHINHQPVLLTDTDSLLTPRTVSLSNAFVTLPGRDTTLTTTTTTAAAAAAAVGVLRHDIHVPVISLPQQQNLDTSSSNGPMFEPVSPSEDFSSIDSTKERGM